MFGYPPDRPTGQLAVGERLLSARLHAAEKAARSSFKDDSDKLNAEIKRLDDLYEKLHELSQLEKRIREVFMAGAAFAAAREVNRGYE